MSLQDLTKWVSSQRSEAEQPVDQPLAMGNNKPSLSVDEAADQIAWGGWNNVSGIVTYAFRSSNSSDAGFERFDANLIAATNQALDLWSDVAGIEFNRVGSGTTGDAAYSDNATMLFSGDTDSGGYGWAYYPGFTASSSLSGDVFLNTSGQNFDNVSMGTYDFMAIVHEIGHAIGLAHPGAYNGGAPTYANDAEYVEDSRQYTVMSYFDAENTGAQHGWNFASTPLLHDIAAVQSLYGANFETRAGDTTYGFESNAGRASYEITSLTHDVVFAIWDGGGNDTLNLSGYRQDQTIDLNEGAFTDAGGLTGNIAIAQGVTIENAIAGAGDDVVTGNDVGNSLEGKSGKDELHGAAGDDNLSGGSSNDRLFGEADDDFLSGGAHKDWLWGGEGADTLNGGSGDDYLYGDDGDDLLLGTQGVDRIWGGAGNDRIESGTGDDKIYADAGDDIIIGGSGFDTLDFSQFSEAVVVDLHAHLATGSESGNDVIWGVESVVGTSGDDIFKGDLRDNDLRGGDGNDSFRGLGGADTFKGGRGADTYHWAEKDVIRDGVHTGTDVILDFSVGQDILNLKDLVTIGSGESVGDHVQLVDSEAGTMLQVDIGGEEFVDVVLLSGLHDLNENALLDDGSIMV